MMYSSSLVLSALCFLALTCACFAVPSPLEWHYSTTVGTHPTPRDNGAVFNIGNNKLGLFGGFYEQLALNKGANVFYNGFYVFDAPTRTWTLLSGDQKDQNGPSPRSFSCGVYHAPSNNVIIFGGVQYTNDLNPETSTYYNDVWSYNLGTNTWTQRAPLGGSPSPRPSGGCDILGDSLYYFSGNGPFFSTDNEMWRYDITAGNGQGLWVKLQNSTTNESVAPRPRTQFVFERIPGSSKFILVGGDTFIILEQEPFLDSVTVDDVWTYDAATNTWQMLANTNTPAIRHTQQAFAMVTSRYLFVQNGDAQGNHSTDDTCPPPNFCILPATPTDDTFVYDLQQQRWTQLDLPFTVPATRRSMMRFLDDTTLFFFGGYGWDGASGRGDIHNPYTWELDLTEWLFNASRTPCTEQWQCSGVSTDYNFVGCVNGFCQCKDTFQGAATASNKCSCNAANLFTSWGNNGEVKCLNRNNRECQRRDECAPLSENYNFVDCVNGRCECAQGFAGAPSTTDKCRCNGQLSWPSGTPQCN
jgi:N-acetylneuraminic acid mutarotase